MGQSRVTMWRGPRAIAVLILCSAVGVSGQARSLLGGAVSLDWTYTSTETTFTVDVSVSPGENGWFAVGVNDEVAMSGTDMIVAFLDASSGTVSVSDMYASSYQRPAADPDQDVTLVSQSVSDGRFTARFSRPNSATSQYDKAIQPSGTQNLIYAYKGSGGGSSLSTFRQHNSYGNLNVVFSEGAQTAVETSVSKPKAWTSHGFLMATSIGILMPLGVLSARLKKTSLKTRGLWFIIHRALQASAVVLAIGGFVIAYDMCENRHMHTKHAKLGATIFALAVFNPVLAAVRPHDKTSDTRKKWYYAHATVGYLVILLGCVNIFWGLDLYRDAGATQIAYGVWVALLVLSFVGSTIISRNPDPAAVKMNEMEPGSDQQPAASL